MKKTRLTFLLLISMSFSVFGGDAGREYSEWLDGALYGSDNGVAALKKVEISREGEGYRVYIKNQFGFACELSLDGKGRPALLSDCVSEDEPGWRVREREIRMSCIQTKSEDICRGSYTLCSSRGYCDGEKMTIAKRRK